MCFNTINSVFISIKNTHRTRWSFQLNTILKEKGKKSFFFQFFHQFFSWIPFHCVFILEAHTRRRIYLQIFRLLIHLRCSSSIWCTVLLLLDGLLSLYLSTCSLVGCWVGNNSMIDVLNQQVCECAARTLLNVLYIACFLFKCNLICWLTLNHKPISKYVYT